MPILFSSKAVCTKLSHLIIKYWWVVILASLFLSLASYTVASKITVNSNFLAFLPDSFPGVKNLRHISEIRGGFGNFMLVTQGGKPETRRSFVRDFIEKARKLDWVEYAESEKGWDKIKQSKLLFIDHEDLKDINRRLNRVIDERKIEKTKLYISFLNPNEKSDLNFSDIERKYQSTSFGTPYYEDVKQNYTIGILWPKGTMTDMSFSRRAYADLLVLKKEFAERAAKEGLEIDIGGEYRNKIDEYDSLLQNVAGTSVLTLVLISLLLIWNYKKWFSVVLILLPLFAGSLWTVAAAQMMVGQLNLLTVFLVAILFGIGIDYGIYLFSSYSHFREQGEEVKSSLTAVYWESGKPLAGAALTTALAFAILMTTDFRGFFEFGLLAAVGILILFFSYLFLGPALWIAGEKSGLISFYQIKRQARYWPVFLSRKVILVALVLGGMGLVAASNLKFEYDYGKLRSLKNSYWKLDGIIHEVFPLSKTPAVILTESLEETSRLVETIQSQLSDWTTVDTVKSILDFMPKDRDLKMQEIASIRKKLEQYDSYFSAQDRQLLDQWLPYLNPSDVTLADMPPSLQKQFYFQYQGQEYYPVLIYDKVRLSDVRNAMKYASEIRVISTPEKDYYPAESSLLFADAMNVMKKESVSSFALMLLAVLLMLRWELKKWSEALIAIVPSLLGFLILFIFMYFFDLKLNIFNMVIFPILLGLADDGALHLFYHLKHLKKGESVKPALARVGQSLVLASLTTLFGFASLAFADHQGLRSLGVLACVGILSNLLSCLIFFPAIATWYLSQGQATTLKLNEP